MRRRSDIPTAVRVASGLLWLGGFLTMVPVTLMLIALPFGATPDNAGQPGQPNTPQTVGLVILLAGFAWLQFLASHRVRVGRSRTWRALGFLLFALQATQHLLDHAVAGSNFTPAAAAIPMMCSSGPGP